MPDVAEQVSLPLFERKRVAPRKPSRAATVSDKLVADAHAIDGK